MFPIGSLSNNVCPITLQCTKAMSFLLTFLKQLAVLGYAFEFEGLEMINKLLVLYIFHQDQTQVHLPRQ